ncbi:MAG: trypsin-like serine protease [Bdellovibrionales bacterium]|nr:trypsin-like serine protease [Bdellovibrionales bacterium]
MREGMRLVACTILLVLLISGCGGSQGTSESSNSRIINGAKLETPELTGVVSVQIASLTAPGQYCTASVIGTRHLLTAAHCVPQGEYLYGVVNLPDRNVPLAMIYKNNTFETVQDLSLNDVAVLESSEDLGLPILPLFVSSSAILGEKVQLLGYGLDENEVYGELRSGSMVIRSLEYGRILLAPDENDSRACHGDSGGPAIQMHLNQDGSLQPAIIGVVSYGTDPECGPHSLIGLTNIQNTDVLDFILQVNPNVPTV